MARFVKYRCPDCGGEFRHLHHPSDAPPPDRCPLCHSWMSDDEPPEAVFEPQAPGIRKSSYAKSVDQTYRAMELSSAERAEEAADALRDRYVAEDRESPHQGDPGLLKDFQRNQIDELRSGLKITDMKDPSQMREGDIAAISSSPNLPGAGFKSLEGIPASPVPGNAAFISKATSDHTSRAIQMIRSGRLNR